jgi:AraC-like DNA-binding protein
MGMARSGSTTFRDPSDFHLGVADATIGLVLTSGGQFSGRVSWLTLQSLGLSRVEESLSRIGFVSLAARAVFVSFPLDTDSASLWCGARVRRGDLVLHARGERFHQVTDRASRWGLISIGSTAFAAYSKALLGRQMGVPATARFMRPAPSGMTDLLRLHAQACRMASANPEMLEHREVGRALEQELIRALITVLGSGMALERSKTRERHAAIMIRFEKALAAHKDRPAPISRLSAAIGVPQGTLRICCKEFLGRSPTSYVRLRRLNIARSALSKANTGTTSVGGIARGLGFSEAGRFAGAYRALFGETPSATLLRSSAESA